MHSIPRNDSTDNTNTETPHDYTMREAELCLSAVLAHLAKADIHIIKHAPSRHAPFYEVRHGLHQPQSWSTYDTLHEAYAHALIVAQVVAKFDTEAAARGAGGED